MQLGTFVVTFLSTADAFAQRASEPVGSASGVENPIKPGGNPTWMESPTTWFLIGLVVGLVVGYLAGKKAGTTAVAGASRTT